MCICWRPHIFPHFDRQECKGLQNAKQYSNTQSVQKNVFMLFFVFLPSYSPCFTRNCLEAGGRVDLGGAYTPGIIYCIVLLTQEALGASVVRGTLAGVRSHTATTVGTRQLTHSWEETRRKVKATNQMSNPEENGIVTHTSPVHMHLYMHGYMYECLFVLGENIL